MWKRNATKISCYRGACLGWGFQADLASSQGRVRWAPARHLGTRHVELHLGGGGVALTQQSTPCSASITTPPHYLIYWCSWAQNLRRTAHRETKAEKSAKRQAVRAIIQCCLLTACLLRWWVEHAHIRSSQRNSISLESFWEDPVFFQTILSK